MNVLESDDIIVTVPDYLLDSDSLERYDNELSSEQSEDQESIESEESGRSVDDYSSQLDYISSLLTSIDSTSDETLILIDNLNNNLLTFHNDVKILIGFGFCFMIYLVIKLVSTIFNKVLGFSNC